MKSLTFQPCSEQNDLAKLRVSSKAFSYSELGVATEGLGDMETLTALDLTSRQARVYLALLNSTA
jgi:hypothetical protein